MVGYESLRETGLGLYDFKLMNDALDAAEENERRVNRKDDD